MAYICPRHVYLTQYTMQLQNFRLMAQYNQQMNAKLYQCAQQLKHEDLIKDMGAFFRSVQGTLNHLLVADIIWLRRFASHPAQFQSLQAVTAMEQPHALDQVLHEDLSELAAHRELLDNIIVTFVDELTDETLSTHFSYHNMKGENFNDRLGYPLQHFFNHQTHHRGQLTTLFNQLGIEVGVTDLLMTIRDANLD